MKTYKIYYMGKDANYPEFKAESEAEALEQWAEKVSAISGEDVADILDEDWTSPRGVEKCARAVEIDES